MHAFGSRPKCVHRKRDLNLIGCKLFINVCIALMDKYALLGRLAVELATVKGIVGIITTLNLVPLRCLGVYLTELDLVAAVALLLGGIGATRQAGVHQCFAVLLKENPLIPSL